ncbi:MAG TPA: nucleotidyltransferase [Amaricoccus sp.]|uniref:nucleotidyltransferase domain-containing protein n=1 Tax=Amaricoccus sp. TaxID=1872485 RepID=UPI002CEC4537|nr:nucleotidyltransferase [Amaricoccus sp.]HMR52675.1 nucleotidyltransferase [Amaricoccus sp.]HMU01599.1 nucleotidyltransferase [Amaricoccus sp.]
MNAFLGKTTSPWDSVSEQMLAAVAIKIELPPSMHALLAERKAAIEKHLERDGSPLKGKVRLFYQQGSVAIGATIRAKFRFEGFDIDIIVELTTPGMTPWQALELLYEAMRGERGSRYYDMTERQTRCVTIHYSDGMHLDLSPAELIYEIDPRRSYIYHSKPEEPRNRDRKVLTNSFGFAEVYNATCPVDLSFQQEYARRALRADQGLVAMQKDADSLPVPVHSSVVGGKSAVTVALQLLKRNRNIRWATRDGRMPASVMFSCLTLEVAEAGRTISQNLRIIAQHILDRLLKAKSVGLLIHVENPRCPGDVFTDRWPENHAAQDTLIADMRLFLNQLDILLDDRRSLRERRDVLKSMFGESIGEEVMDELEREYGEAIRTGMHTFGTTGGISISPAIAKAKPAVKPSTFYGSKWPRR